jgi:hypothetical protein
MNVGVMKDYKLRDLRASHTLGWILVQYAMIHHDMSPSLEAYVRANLNHLHVRMTQIISWFLPHDTSVVVLCH